MAPFLKSLLGSKAWNSKRNAIPDLPISKQAHQSCIFNRLPYDVRAMIYYHLEPGLAIPPHQCHCMGFILSCRQAKDEIEALSPGNLERIRAGIEDVSGANIIIGVDPGHRRKITVVLPFAAFDMSTRYANWKEEVLVSMRPIFAHYADIVRIHVTGNLEPNTMSQPESLKIAIRSLIRGIGAMIDRSCNYKEAKNRRQGFPLGTVSHEIASRFSSFEVNATRICMTWDLRESPVSNRVRLRGVTWQMRSLFVSKRRRPWFLRDARVALAVWKKKRRERRLGPFDLRSRFESIYYHVEGDQHLVGEIGIVSPGRWAWRGTSVAGMVDEDDIYHGTEREIVSVGLGEAVTYRRVLLG